MNHGRYPKCAIVFRLSCCLSFLSFPAVAVDYAAYGKVAASVVRVVARIPNTNSTSFGSGVVLPGGRVVTNCHVIPGAGKVVVLEGAIGTEVERGPRDFAADLCVLHPVALTVPAAQTAVTGTLQVGDEVVAIGFGGGGGRSISSGRVTALYPYRGGQVIQTTAAFRQGASGGGLFDRHGNLVGITTFFRRSGAESAFFAIPVEWIDALMASPDIESESALESVLDAATRRSAAVPAGCFLRGGRQVVGDGSGGAVVDAGGARADEVLGGAQPRADGTGRLVEGGTAQHAGATGFRVRAHFDSVDGTQERARSAAVSVLLRAIRAYGSKNSRTLSIQLLARGLWRPPSRSLICLEFHAAFPFAAT